MRITYRRYRAYASGVLKRVTHHPSLMSHHTPMEETGTNRGLGCTPINLVDKEGFFSTLYFSVFRLPPYFVLFAVALIPHTHFLV